MSSPVKAQDLPACKDGRRSFKDQLDELATKAKHGAEDANESSIVEKGKLAG
jgi:hypothetical protein